MRFYWRLDNRYDSDPVQGWDKTNGWFYQDGLYTNVINWQGGTGA